MAQQATKGIHPSLEKEAWDLFEVGANEEVLLLAKSQPENHYIQHLAFLASYELKGNIAGISPKGISSLSPIVEAIVNFNNGRYIEAASHLSLYFQSANHAICYSIINLALKIYFRSENFSDALKIISIFKSKSNDQSFAKEEIIATYNLRKYEEVIKFFRENIKQLNDSDIHKIVGMSLLFLDRHKEANLIFENIPGKMNLPSFEEKRESYKTLFSNIGSMESNSGNLSMKELEDMGFAYLFHGEYEKAEKTFLSITSKLKPTLCNA
ncbi:hypothetical protein EHQ58_14315 [Leptospira ognonensis]|uniref:Tetratricopeptide repeat protein n=1 Tax=Leptospira ognonensis TaxID=2484945 RepID=A0A4R9JY55_9LEPT|nr:hypothetical protein [Leptospira ognonensis]TGL57452.1 hypothetical protein EHQ58_14315 [Leptospira ognonensis]